MSPKQIVRAIGIIILLGLVWFAIYEYQSASKITGELGVDSMVRSNDTSDLHSGDTYYLIVAPTYLMVALLTMPLVIAIAFISIPSKIVLLFQKKLKKNVEQYAVGNPFAAA